MPPQPAGFASPWLHLGLSAFCTTISQLLLKRGAVETAYISERWGWTGVTALASPLVWVAILFVICSFVTWLYVLRHLPLSRAFPASQIVHVTIPVSSWIVLGDVISPIRWCGIVLVLTGLALVARPVAKLEEKL